MTDAPAPRRVLPVLVLAQLAGTSPWFAVNAVMPELQREHGWAAADVGNVYPLVSDLSLSDLRYAAGLGLRYRTAFGPLRLDWGYKLDRRAGEKPYQVHVTVGHAF